MEAIWIYPPLAPQIFSPPGLHEAVAADSIEAAKKLLAHGCLLNATDSMQDERWTTQFSELENRHPE